MQGSFLKKRGGLSKRFVIMPIILILVLCFAAGLNKISIARQFYFQEKVKEASLLARGYEKAIVIEAEYQLDQQLRQLGDRISIDTLGSGFSFLSRLGSLEIDIRKRDRLFVMSLSEPSERNLVSDVISMAHHPGKKVATEGVETTEREQWLEDAPGGLLQGYLFNRPLSASDAILPLEQEKPHHA